MNVGLQMYAIEISSIFTRSLIKQLFNTSVDKQ